MFQVCPKNCVLAQWSTWSACKWEWDGNQRAYRKSRTRTITKRELANGVSCDLFSLEESDACPLNWNDDLATCPNELNTFLIDGRCYMFVDQEKSFNDAKAYCESKLGRLFEPRSVHTNKLVYDKGYEVLNKNLMWFGIISIKGKSGPWKFASSGKNVVQTIWYEDQPNENGSVCGYYSYYDNNEWYDTDCTDALRFICEFV